MLLLSEFEIVFWSMFVPAENHLNALLNTAYYTKTLFCTAEELAPFTRALTKRVPVFERQYELWRRANEIQPTNLSPKSYNARFTELQEIDAGITQSDSLI